MYGNVPRRMMLQAGQATRHPGWDKGLGTQFLNLNQQMNQQMNPQMNQQNYLQTNLERLRYRVCRQIGNVAFIALRATTQRP